MLSTDIFFAIVGAQYDQGRAASLALILSAFALAVFVAQRRLLGSTSYTTGRRPLEYFIAFHRGDRSAFEVDLSSPAGNASRFEQVSVTQDGFVP